eukprot:6486646-Pyramimonas_sp.AAC.1
MFPDVLPPLPSQWAVQWVRFQSVDIAFVTAYFVVGVGLGEPDLSLLTEIGQYLLLKGSHFVIMADWNMTPDEVGPAGFDTYVG